MNQQEFEAIIHFRKQECNRNGFNALHISVEELAELCGRCRYIELSSYSDFNGLYVSNMLFGG